MPKQQAVGERCSKRQEDETKKKQQEADKADKAAAAKRLEEEKAAQQHWRGRSVRRRRSCGHKIVLLRKTGLKPHS
jgi:hypothetical protein